MLANIANFVRQDVNIPKGNALLPVFEAVSNSLDAIADRPGGGWVRIKITRHPNQTDGTRGAPFEISVEDNGVGFNDENMDSFSELFTAHKSKIGGKGRGRFAFLKVFDRARVSSTFQTDDDVQQRNFDFDFSFVGDKRPPVSPALTGIGTQVILQGMKEGYAKEVPQTFETLLRRFIWHFLPTLLAAKDIQIFLDDGEEVELGDYVRSTLQLDAKPEPFKVADRDFLLTHVRLYPRADVKHRLIMAAMSREVDDGFRLAKRIPLLAHGPLHDEVLDQEFVYVGLLQGKYLDDMANPLRLGFLNDEERLEEEAEENEDAQRVPLAEAIVQDLFREPQSISQVRNDALKRIKQFLEPFLARVMSTRVTAIQDYIRKDGMGYHFLRENVVDVARGLKRVDEVSIENALHRAAFEEKKARKQDVQRLLSSTPKEKNEDAYFERWQSIVDSLSNVAKSDLAEYVAHRRAILDLVDDLLRATVEGGAHAKEEVIHSVVFPKGTQSGQVGYEQQNLWLIDERLAFHEHLFSDRSIKSISRGETDALQRPDLAIFESGFASFYDGANPPANVVLVELKRPARKDASRDDPVQATLDYVRKLKAGNAYTEGNAVIDVQKNAQTTVYILADWTADFQSYLDDEDFQEMPGENGRYKHHSKENIMFIAYSFKRLIENARMRNRIYFRKLGIE